MELIQRIKQGEDEALKTLVKEYRPVIERLKRKYYRRDYDLLDWEQEALIACYIAAVKFKGARGRFASFFDRCLNNHFCSLIRPYMTPRRKPYLLAESLDRLIEEEDIRLIHESRRVHPEYFIEEFYDEIFASLTKIEAIALAMLMGITSPEEIYEKWGYNDDQIQHARWRVQYKFRDALK
ncbi:MULTISPECIES: sigma factor [Lactobacillus]|uniref:Sigma-70 family RNA polymerase sigma factor n=2 Tax=Lactobacillus xujianguonis TaxID=2495899 RepID=A0A437SV57_9LACO|nr:MULTISPECIES: sigma factor [Lactobacillus]RVU70816.1 sigma-70 family RNA polymerase sigma factor [Lactobacillus xujianguonis]